MALALAGCDKPAALEPIDPEPGEVAAYLETTERLFDLKLIDDAGFIVSRWQDGRPEHEGDSLLWTGIALAALPCERTGKLVAGLTRMVYDLGGGLYRHPSLPRSVSLDGAMGFYFGVADHIQRCGSAATWRRPLELIAAFSEDTGLINRASTAKLLPEFTLPRDLVLSLVGARRAPWPGRMLTLEAEAVTWAQAAKSARYSCFRVHIGWLALAAAERAGMAPSAPGREMFCRVTDGLELPLIDHWCRRYGLDGYLATFRFNTWEYRHQRCPAWESPDGKPGLITPAIDRLIALRTVYDL